MPAHSHDAGSMSAATQAWDTPARTTILPGKGWPLPSKVQVSRHRMFRAYADPSGNAVDLAGGHIHGTTGMAGGSSPSASAAFPRPEFLHRDVRESIPRAHNDAARERRAAFRLPRQRPDQMCRACCSCVTSRPVAHPELRPAAIPHWRRRRAGNSPGPARKYDSGNAARRVRAQAALRPCGACPAGVAQIGEIGAIDSTFQPGWRRSHR